MTAKFFTKKRRSGSTSEPSSKDTKQTVPWPRDSTPVTTSSGARRRQWSSITPSCYTLRQKGTARIADDAQLKWTREHLTARTGYNKSSIAIVSRWLGWYSEASKQRSKGGARVFAAKPVTKAKDTTPSLQEREPGKDIAWNHPRRPAEAEARMKSASRSRTAQLVCPEGFHEAPSKF